MCVRACVRACVCRQSIYLRTSVYYCCDFTQHHSPSTISVHPLWYCISSDMISYHFVNLLRVLSSIFVTCAASVFADSWLLLSYNWPLLSYDCPFLFNLPVSQSHSMFCQVIVAPVPLLSSLWSSYLHQVNGVNAGDCFRSMCVSLCLRVCVCAQRTGQSDQLKTVKATDFTSDVHVPRNSPDMIH